MRWRPLSGLSLPPLKPSALQRKPSEPSAAGVPIAAASVSRNSAPTGSATALNIANAAPAGSKIVTSRMPMLSERASMSSSAETSIGPAKASQPAPTSTISAVPSSRDWSTSPSSAASR